MLALTPAASEIPMNRLFALAVLSGLLVLAGSNPAPGQPAKRVAGGGVPGNRSMATMAAKRMPTSLKGRAPMSRAMPGGGVPGARLARGGVPGNRLAGGGVPGNRKLSTEGGGVPGGPITRRAAHKKE